MALVRLGLIGDNIAASHAPRLHVLAGALHGIEVRYDLLVPAEFGLGFDRALRALRERALPRRST